MPRKKPSDLIFSVTECFGNLVDLQRQTWEVHILDSVEGHPQMAGWENLVQQVLKDPLEVWTGKIPTRAVFVSDPGVGPRPEGIRVVVEYGDVSFEKGAASGIVTTAYPIDLVTYPTPQMRRKILSNRR